MARSVGRAPSRDDDATIRRRGDPGRPLRGPACRDVALEAGQHLLGRGMCNIGRERFVARPKRGPADNDTPVSERLLQADSHHAEVDGERDPAGVRVRTGDRDEDPDTHISVALVDVDFLDGLVATMPRPDAQGSPVALEADLRDRGRVPVPQKRGDVQLGLAAADHERDGLDNRELVVIEGEAMREQTYCLRIGTFAEVEVRLEAFRLRERGNDPHCG